MKKTQRNVLAACAAVIVAALAAVFGLRQAGDEPSDGFNLPSEVSGRVVGESSEQKNERYEREEAEKRKEADKAMARELEEGPSEGLSRRPEDNLELPDAIVGSREVIIYKSQYIVSYNLATRCPNYVCWELTPDRIQGPAKRSDKFTGDIVLQGTARVESDDYARSGYDRGHMCPAGDNKNSQQAMDESFFMTNICPQVHSLNSGDWSELENQCRSWAKNYGGVYICCGPIFDSKKPKTFGQRTGVKISVPDRFFKVVFMMGRQPKAIGFVMPNSSTNKDLREYAMSVDEVESITGIDFFYQIPQDIQDAAEAECNPAAWGI